MTASAEQAPDEERMTNSQSSAAYQTSSVGVHSVTSRCVESSVQDAGSNPVPLLNSELRRIIGAFGAGYLLGKSGTLDLGIIAQIFV